MDVKFVIDYCIYIKSYHNK